MNTINEKSIKSVRLEILSENTKRSITWATGFLCTYKENLFLVTNWHVVRGRNSFSKELLSKKGAIPGFLKFDMKIYKREGNVNIDSKIATIEFELYEYNKDEGFYDVNKPRWTEHDLGNEIDVVAINLNYYKQELDKTGCSAQSYNIEEELNLTQFTYGLSVMNNIFIIGFPLRMSLSPNEYPIYKGATIASEPQIENQSKPIILIDGKTKSGMSGSPVVVTHKISWDEKKTPIMNQQQLIGIYSGRESQSKDLTEAELGIVWKLKECLIPILNKASR